MARRRSISTVFPYTTLFRSEVGRDPAFAGRQLAVRGRPDRGKLLRHGPAVLPPAARTRRGAAAAVARAAAAHAGTVGVGGARSEEHTSELQSRPHMSCSLLL